jgi:hypothetical protein
MTRVRTIGIAAWNGHGNVRACRSSIPKLLLLLHAHALAPFI